MAGASAAAAVAWERDIFCVFPAILHGGYGGVIELKTSASYVLKAKVQPQI